MWEIPLTALILVLGVIAAMVVSEKLNQEQRADRDYMSLQKRMQDHHAFVMGEIKKTQDEMIEYKQKVDSLAVRVGFKL